MFINKVGHHTLATCNYASKTFSRPFKCITTLTKRVTKQLLAALRKSEESWWRRGCSNSCCCFFRHRSGSISLSGKLLWHLTGSDSNKAGDCPNTGVTQRMLLWFTERKLTVCVQDMAKDNDREKNLMSVWRSVSWTVATTQISDLHPDWINKFLGKS